MCQARSPQADYHSGEALAAASTNECENTEGTRGEVLAAKAEHNNSKATALVSSQTQLLTFAKSLHISGSVPFNLLSPKYRPANCNSSWTLETQGTAMSQGTAVSAGAAASQ